MNDINTELKIYIIFCFFVEEIFKTEVNNSIYSVNSINIKGKPKSLKIKDITPSFGVISDVHMVCKISKVNYLH